MPRLWPASPPPTAKNGRVYDEVRHLAAVYRTDLSLRDALLSPVLPAAAKEALFRQVLDGTVSRTLEGFVSLVLRRRREKYLCFMLHSYVSLYKQRHGILDATLTTAAPGRRRGGRPDRRSDADADPQPRGAASP